ncbi:MAG TPA: hypothetical protein VFQ43_16005, partial [Nitrososphaera sp.]|nr:hypothetical protein [Nitrososphaera sp.]
LHRLIGNSTDFRSRKLWLLAPLRGKLLKFLPRDECTALRAIAYDPLANRESLYLQADISASDASKYQDGFPFEQDDPPCVLSRYIVP